MNERGTKVTEFTIFIASPGDVDRERQIVVDVAQSINNRMGKELGFRFDAIRWQTHAASDSGERVQELINPFVRECDIFVGILWARFGTHSGVEESGTLEEFKEALAVRERTGNRPTMLVYFSERPIDRKLLRDEEVKRQIRRVDEFREEHEAAHRLASTYESDEEFENQVREQLVQWCSKRVKAGLPDSTAVTESPANELRHQRQRFLASEVARNKYLEMTAFETRVRIPVALEEVLVPVRARVGLGRDGLVDADDKRLARRGGAREDEVIELGDAWQRARAEKIPTVVVLGAPGSGKTTLLRSMLLRCAEDPNLLSLPDDTLPLLLPLRAVRTDEPLPRAAARILDTEEQHLDSGFFEYFLREGRAFVLLDGLDEVASSAERGAVSRWIEKERRKYHDCPFVVTARFAGYRGDARLRLPAMELSLERFREAEIRSFLRRWYETVERAIRGRDDAVRMGAELATELTERVLSTPELYRLATNPLMLQIIALVHRDRGALPDRRVELYDECVNVLLEHWDRARGIDVPITAREARRVLQPVAYWMHQEPDRRYASTADLVPLIEKEMNRLPSVEIDAANFLDRVRDRSGLFVGHGSDEYGFPHLSFQEYLAACEVRRLGTYDALAREYDEVWWREVTKLLMGLDNPGCFEPFMRAVIDAGKLVGHNEFTSQCINDAFEPSADPFAAAFARTVGQPPDEVSNLQYHLLLALQELPAEILRSVDRQILRRVAGSAGRDLAAALARGVLERLGERVASVPSSEAGLPETRANQTDDSELVLIPAGPFQAGSKGDADDNPPRTIELGDFYLARYPVTNEQYARFLTSHPDLKTPGFWDDERFNQPRQPVVGVTWRAGGLYCEWAGSRLPTEWEWEKAARGTDGRRYPWGAEEPSGKLASFGDPSAQPTPVGSFPAGAGPYGHLDLAGNVWEWTASLYRDDEKPRTLRGGSFDDGAEGLRASFRGGINPGHRYDIVGFRCAQDP